MSLLPVIDKVKALSIYNLQPWTHSNAKDITTSLFWPNKMIKELAKKGLVQPITINNYDGYLLRHECFYSTKAMTIAGGLGGPEGSLRHRSALTDVLLAFHYLYKDCEVSVKHSPRYKVKAGIYNPDAEVTVTLPDLTKYVFMDLLK